MSRPRTPTAVLELKGAFRKNPKRGEMRAMEPEAVGELAAPAEFLREDVSIYPRLLAIWNETVRVCWWLTAAEAAPLESYCRLKDKERRGVAKNADLTNLFKLYPILGMTQDGRGKFSNAAGSNPGQVKNGRGWGTQSNEDWEDIREASEQLRVG